MSRFEFERIDLAVTSLLANQLVALVSEHARHQWQRADVPGRSMSVFRYVQTFNLLYCYRQVAVSKVGSAIAVFRLVDNIMLSRLQIVH